MASKRLTKTCPHCRKVYETRTVSAWGRQITAEDRWVFGMPLKSCPSCHRLFIDPDVQELALTEPRKKDKALVSGGSLRLAALGVALAAVLYAGGQRATALAIGGVAVLTVIADLALYPYRMKKLDREREASRQRLSDPAYAKALKDAGYKVPEAYLKE